MAQYKAGLRFRDLTTDTEYLVPIIGTITQPYSANYIQRTSNSQWGTSVPTILEGMFGVSFNPNSPSETVSILKSFGCPEIPAIADDDQYRTAGVNLGGLYYESLGDDEYEGHYIYIQRRSNSSSGTGAFDLAINYHDSDQDMTISNQNRTIAPPQAGIYNFGAWTNIADTSTYLLWAFELYDEELDEVWGFVFYSYNKITLYNSTTGASALYNYDATIASPSGQGIIDINLKYLAAQTGKKIKIPTLSSDPFSQLPDRNTDPDGGVGTYDFSSDQIDDEDITTAEFQNVNASSAGFVTLYQPSTAMLKTIASELSGSNIWDTLANYFGSWTDVIVGLGILPFRPNISGLKKPIIATKEFSAMPVIASQFNEVDCGELTVAEIYGMYLDYAPYSRISIYLPYVGVRELDVDEVMGTTLHVKYKIDCYSGNCVAYIMVNGSTRYQFNGNCLEQVPVNSVNMDAIISNGIQLATTVVSGVATGGAAIAAAGASVAAAETGAAATQAAVEGGLADQSANGGLSEGALARGQAQVNSANQKTNVAKANYRETVTKSIVNPGSSAVSSVLGSKPMPERTGSLGGSAGLMSVQFPFLIWKAPDMSIPDGYMDLNGFPSNQYVSSLGSVSGYTEIQSIRLNNLAATQPEIAEIYNLLKGGIIV